MTSQKTRLAVHSIVDQNDEDVVREMIDEEMMEWVEEDEIEEHGSLYDAYSEVGRGEAENVVLSGLIKGCGIKLNTDEYCEVMDTLCEIWGIYLN